MTVRVDWPKLLADLAHLLGEPEAGNPAARAPCGERQLTDRLRVPRSTLRGWFDGSEPKHADGERLLDHWGRLTGKARQFAPLDHRSLSASQVR